MSGTIRQEQDSDGQERIVVHDGELGELGDGTRGSWESGDTGRVGTDRVPLRAVQDSMMSVGPGRCQAAPGLAKQSGKHGHVNYAYRYRDFQLLRSCTCI